MPTIISLIELKTIFAENIAILHQEMGSAPNLVVMAYNKDGNPYIKRAFNTQVLLSNFLYDFLTQFCTLRFVNNSMHGLVDNQ